MRVLWVFGGLSAQTQRMAARLVQAGEVTLELMTPTKPTGELARIPHAHLQCRHKLDFAAQARIRARLREGAFDFVHAYTSRDLANVISACRGLPRAPRVIGYRGTINRLRRLDPANWITFWHPRVDRIICVSHATRRALLASRIPAAKLVTVHEGCDPATLTAPDGCARSEFGIPDDAFVVGTVANMRRGKGIDLLLQAARQLAHLSDVYYLLIGQVRDPRITQLAADPRIAERVRLTGPLPSGGRYVGLFDVYAAPSRMEGLSMSIMESMAKRVCAVVSDAGGLPELIRDKVDGLVVPAENVDALAQAIGRLRNDAPLRQRLAAAAHQRALHEFSIEAWTRRLGDFYRNLAAFPATRAA